LYYDDLLNENSYEDAKKVTKKNNPDFNEQKLYDFHLNPEFFRHVRDKKKKR